MLRSHEKEMAITAILGAVAAERDRPSERDQRIAAAWEIGATANELHLATGLTGAELRDIVTEQGGDPGRRKRGWRGMRGRGK